jgi:hypothetical protein
MTRKYLTVAAMAALLAGCAWYDDSQSKSPEAGTAAAASHAGINPPPVSAADNTASVGTTTLYRDPVPTTVAPVYPAPVVVAPGTTVYYDAYGRAYYYDAYGRPVFVR